MRAIGHITDQSFHRWAGLGTAAAFLLCVSAADGAHIDVWFQDGLSNDATMLYGLLPTDATSNPNVTVRLVSQSSPTGPINFQVEGINYGTFNVGTVITNTVGAGKINDDARLTVVYDELTASNDSTYTVAFSYDFAARNQFYSKGAFSGTFGPQFSGPASLSVTGAMRPGDAADLNPLVENFGQSGSLSLLNQSNNVWSIDSFTLDDTGLSILASDLVGSDASYFSLAGGTGQQIIGGGQWLLDFDLTYLGGLPANATPDLALRLTTDEGVAFGAMGGAQFDIPILALTGEAIPQPAAGLLLAGALPLLRRISRG